jgi:hypothetical protein
VWSLGSRARAGANEDDVKSLPDQQAGEAVAQVVHRWVALARLEGCPFDRLVHSAPLDVAEVKRATGRTAEDEAL